MNLDIVNVPADGLCFYHAVSKNFWPASSPQGSVIKELVIAYLKSLPLENKNKYIIPTAMSFDEYVNYIKDDWADNFMIAATADCFNLLIKIYINYSGTQNGPICIGPINRKNEEPKTISVMLVNEHYLALIPKNNPV